MAAETKTMVLAAAAAGEEKKAEDLRILELDKSEAGFTDFFLVMSGANHRQVVAIADEIELRLKREFATYPNSVEGRRLGEWVLMDYVDFVVHIFVAEKRAYYDIERLRKSATHHELAELKTALAEKTKSARKKATKTTAAKKSTVKKSATKKTAAKKATAVKALKKTTVKKAAKKSSK
jgi:ribosome-associated protein